MYAFAAIPPVQAASPRCPTTCSPSPAWSGHLRPTDGHILLRSPYGIAPSHLLAYNVNLAAPDGTFTTGTGDEVELFCLDSAT